jgi:Rrf2 family protein
MQLTRAADYAVRVMIYLAGRPENQRTFLPALAKATQVPNSFLSKVLQALARAGMVSSRRGQQGGFQMLPLGRAASVRAVVEAIDGPINLNVCTVHGKGCPRDAWCPAHPIWTEAQSAMLNILDAAKIADLAASPDSAVTVQLESAPDVLAQP